MRRALRTVPERAPDACVQAHEGMDALKMNLRQEHVVICDFVSTFHQVFA